MSPSWRVIGIGSSGHVGHDAELGKAFFRMPTSAGSVHRDSVASLPSGVLSDGSIAGRAPSPARRAQASLGYGMSLSAV